MIINFARILVMTGIAMMATQSVAADFTFRIGAGHPVAGFAYVQAADSYFIPEVIKRAAAAGHNVRFVRAWAGSVAKVDGIIDAVEKGILDIGLSNPSFEPSKAGLLTISYYAPFVSQDPILMQRVAMRFLKETPAIQESMKPFGVRILQMSTLENYGVLSTYNFDLLEGLRGKKIGLATANSAIFAAAGAIPVVVAAPDAYMSIKNGMIDGEVFFASGLEAFKLHEVTKYFVKTGQGSYIGSAMLMNAATRAKLPSELVTVIDSVAEETSARIAEINVERESASEAKARALGVTITEMPRSELAKWGAALGDLPQRQAKELDAKGQKGTEAFSAYFRLLRETGYDFPYRYSGF